MKRITKITLFLLVFSSIALMEYLKYREYKNREAQRQIYLRIAEENESMAVAADAKARNYTKRYYKSPQVEFEKNLEYYKNQAKRYRQIARECRQLAHQIKT
jgi:hypothetical protein